MSIEKIERKEDIKKVIDTSTDYKELYDNSISVLQKMESTFKDTLKDLAREQNWEYEKRNAINYSIFDGTLNTDNPVTIFEKKGKNLIERAKTIAENRNGFKSSCIQLAKKVGVNIHKPDENDKGVIINELWNTRTNAINDFKKDLEDGVLSNKNNIRLTNTKYVGIHYGGSLFRDREKDSKEFEKRINNMNLTELAYATFNIYEGSGAYAYCYNKFKEKLGTKNLFDYIDSLKKQGDQTSEILKYSALSMLFFRGEANDLKGRLDSYKGRQGILDYIKNKFYKEKDEDFKKNFLRGMKKIEKIPYLKSISDELIKKDSMVASAYKRAKHFDDADVFANRKINALMLYDNCGHGGGSSFFESELSKYKQQGFAVVSEENNNNYKKCTLKKGVDTITMVKLKSGKEFLETEDIKKTLAPIVKGVDYNLFALRGHCYNTDKMAYALGGLNAVGERDIFIDGGCGNSYKINDYHSKGIKGYMFAYNNTGRGNSTQAFIDNIFKRKSEGKNFTSLMDYYNTLHDESTTNGYFAENVERPDTVAYNYQILQVEQLKK